VLSKLSLCAAFGVSVVAVVAVARAGFRRVQVEGASMLPALAQGDRLVVIRTGSPLVGDVVALHDPVEPARLLVKRVVAVLPAGLEVRGDNQAASRDSRTFGLVAPSRLIGKAVYRYFPPARAGFLRHSGSSSGTLVPDGPAPEGY
jgi:nickel-type superoxide dismutase maturation protease